jgi:DNA-directed RNA polymerase subunit RPC12/RpoP
MGPEPWRPSRGCRIILSMLEGTLQCSSCGEPIPRTSRLQDDGTHICPHCGERVDALPRFLGAGRGGEGSGERTDDPVTMPAIPASAFEPAVPVAFTGKHRWKPRKDGPAFVDPDEDAPQGEAFEALRPDPTPAYERVSHEIEAPAPPPVLRADSLPPISGEEMPDLAPAAEEVADAPRVRQPRSRESVGALRDSVGGNRDAVEGARDSVGGPRGAVARREVAAPAEREDPQVPQPAVPAARTEQSPRAVEPRPRVDPQRFDSQSAEPARADSPRMEAPRGPSRPRNSSPPRDSTRQRDPRAHPTPPVAATPARGPSSGAVSPPLQSSPPPKQPAVVAVAPVEEEEEEDGSERYTVTETGDALVVEWRWFGLAAIALGLVASCWTGLFMGWLAVAGYLVSAGGLWLLMAAAGGGMHLLLAAVLSYVAVARFVNRTRVRVSGGGIEVSVGPLPWRGNRTVPVGSVARLALTEHTRGREKTYDLAAVLTQGAQVPIVRGVGQLEEAKHLEGLVARYLGDPMLKPGARRPSGKEAKKKTG